MTRSNNLGSYGPITALVMLMSLFYAVFTLALVPPLVGTREQESPRVHALYPNSDYVNVVVVNVFFMLTLISFLRASFTHPGLVPPVHPFDPDCPAEGAGESAEIQRALQERGLLNYRGIERKSDGRPRFCRICGRYKPDRAHHSTPAGACILELDHMCPWIRQAIGYFNKKYFFLLILYGSCSLVGFVVALTPHFLHACQRMEDVLEFFIVFAWMLALMLGIVVSGFTCFHIYLMTHAYTTVEFCEKRRAPPVKSTQEVSVRDLYSKSPYDLGVLHNVKHVLGPVWTWLIPTRYGMPSGISAGVVFDVNEEHPLYRAAQVGDFSTNAFHDSAFGGISHDEIAASSFAPPAADEAAADSDLLGPESGGYFEEVVRGKSGRKYY